MASINPRQNHFDIEHDVDINGEVKTIVGNMTVNRSAATPNGSFTLKIKSSMLTDNPRDRERLEAAILKSFRDAAYDDDNSLFNQCSQALEVKKSGNPKQKTLTSQFDAMKKAAGKDDDIISDAVIVDDEPKPKKPTAKKAAAKKTTAAKPTASSTTDKPAPVKTRKVNAKLQSVAAQARAKQTGTEIAEA